MRRLLLPLGLGMLLLQLTGCASSATDNSFSVVLPSGWSQSDAPSGYIFGATKGEEKFIVESQASTASLATVAADWSDEVQSADGAGATSPAPVQIAVAGSPALEGQITDSGGVGAGIEGGELLVILHDNTLYGCEFVDDSTRLANDWATDGQVILENWQWSS